MTKAQVVAASIHAKAAFPIVTMEVTMPRYILAEFNTHRVFSRNSASSRAIPLRRTISSVNNNPFIPMAWQKTHTGMQGTEYFTDKDEADEATSRWLSATVKAANSALDLDEFGVTKQLSNRLIEPFMWHKVLVTSTEWENFFNLRCPQYEITTPISNQTHIFKSRKEVLEFVNKFDSIDMSCWSDLDWLKINKGQADIHMMALAEAMYDAYNNATFKTLQPGEWHLPYGDRIIDSDLDKVIYQLNADNGFVATHIPEGAEFDYNTRMFYKRMVAVARCARLSYQLLGDNPVIDYKADIQMYGNLAKAGHLSPFEHVAKAMDEYEHISFIKTIMIDNKPVQEQGWCNNFRGFIQERAYLEYKS